MPPTTASSVATAGPVLSPISISVAAPLLPRRPLSRRPRKPIQLTNLRVHFVGIGGSGMSGLARMCRQRGAVVTGSDMADGPAIEMLNEAGIPVALEQTGDAIPAQCDLVVISAAIKSDHPEVVEAKRRNIRVIKYAKMLGQLMIGKTGISVSGTHGKSSTTSLTSHILIECGFDPSFIVGANCKQIGGGYRVGAGEHLVAEACEYDRSFHNHHPTLATILNVEEDHLDYYSGLNEIIESFRDFAGKLPAAEEGGFLLIQHEMKRRQEITSNLACAVATIGFAADADWRVEVVSAACGVATDRPSITSAPLIQLHRKGELVAAWRSPLPGDHMAYNCAAAAVLAHRCGASWDGIASAIESFRGLDRRMQLLGVRSMQAPVGRPGALEDGVIVVDDYGHHPTEVAASLKALRRHYNPRRLICVFQPHQHSRTRFLLEQFAESFDEADLVIVPHIYFVRDSKKEQHAVKAGDLVDRLRKRGRQAMHLYPFEAIVEQLELIARDGDLVVSMGAGDVYRITQSFLRK